MKKLKTLVLNHEFLQTLILFLNTLIIKAVLVFHGGMLPFL